MKTDYKMCLITALFTIMLFSSCKENQKLYFYCDPLFLTPAVEKKIENFEKKNSNIDIVTVPADYNSLLEKLPGSTTLNVIRYSSDVFSSLPVKEHLLSPTALLDSSFLSDFNENALATVTFNNILYGIPDMVPDTVVLYYDSNLVDEKKIERITLENLPELLKKNKEIPYGIVYNQFDPYIFYYLLSASGLKLSSAKDYQNFYTRETIRLFNHLTDLLSNEQFPFPADSKRARELFLKGESLLYLSYYNEYSELREQNENIRILKGTGFIRKNITPASWGRSYAYGLAGVMDDTKKNSARDFITYMTSNEEAGFYKNYGALPVKKSLLTEEQVQILANIHNKPPYADYSAYYKVLYEIMLKYYNKQLSPEETVLRIHNALNNS